MKNCFDRFRKIWKMSWEMKHSQTTSLLLNSYKQSLNGLERNGEASITRLSVALGLEERTQVCLSGMIS